MFTFKHEDEKRSNLVARKLEKGLKRRKYALSSNHYSIHGLNKSRVTTTNWSIIDITPENLGRPVGSLTEHFHNHDGQRSLTQRTGQAFGVALTPNDIGCVLWGDMYSEIEKYENKHGV